MTQAIAKQSDGCKKLPLTDGLGNAIANISVKLVWQICPVTQ